MDLRRLTRVIAAQWGVVLIGALIGLIGALLFLTLGDQSIESVFEATAPMRFDPAEGQTIPELAHDVAEARDFALIAGEALLRSEPTSRITLNLAEAKLFFIGQGSTETEAIEKAVALRQAYLDVDPELGGGVDAALVNLEREALSLDAQIASLQPELSAADLVLIDNQTQLDLVIAGMRSHLVGLILSEAGLATIEERDLIVAERILVQAELDQLLQDRAVLGPIPEPQQSTTDALLLQTFLARKILLNAEYQRLYLRKLGVAGLGTAENVTVDDFVSDPIAPLIVTAIGLLGGAIVAAVGLMMVSQTRRTMWLPQDIDVPVLGQIPARDFEGHATDAWYETVEGGPRKTAIQALRSAVQAHAPGGGSTIALSAHNIPAGEVHALARDLAGSMASAGDSVLMIDANLQSPVALGVFRIGGVSLADVLQLQPDVPEFAAEVDSAVDTAHVVRPGLAVIPSGPSPDSPADALAGRQFRSLIASAEGRFDTTIVVVDDFGTPSSQAAMQRLRHGILITAPGSTTEAEVNGLIAGADRVRISIVGAVFLGKRGRLSDLFRRKEANLFRRKEAKSESVLDSDAPQAHGTETSPMTRLHNYAVPDERRSALVPHSPLGELASTMGVSDDGRYEDGGLGAQLLTAVNGISRTRAYDAVADYVISRAEDMVTARYGYGDLMETLR